MTRSGRVINGVVVLESGPALPEGAEVDVIAREVQTPPEGEDIPPLIERLKSVAGVLRGLPSDLAARHDHYIHGTRRS